MDTKKIPELRKTTFKKQKYEDTVTGQEEKKMG